MSCYLKIHLIIVAAASYSILIMFHSTFSSDSVLKISAEKRALKYLSWAYVKAPLENANLSSHLKYSLYINFCVTEYYIQESHKVLTEKKLKAQAIAWSRETSRLECND